MAAVQWWGRVAAKPAWSGAWLRQQQIPTIWSVRHKAVSAFCSWLEPDACCSTDFGLHCLKQEMVRSFSKVTGVMLFLPNSEMQHDWNRQLAHSNCSDCASSFQVNATWTLLCTQCQETRKTWNSWKHLRSTGGHWGLLQYVYTTCYATWCVCVCEWVLDVFKKLFLLWSAGEHTKSILNNWCCCFWLPGTSWLGCGSQEGSSCGDMPPILSKSMSLLFP